MSKVEKDDLRGSRMTESPDPWREAEEGTGGVEVETVRPCVIRLRKSIVDRWGGGAVWPGRQVGGRWEWLVRL